MAIQDIKDMDPGKELTIIRLAAARVAREQGYKALDKDGKEWTTPPSKVYDGKRLTAWACKKDTSKFTSATITELDGEETSKPVIARYFVNILDPKGPRVKLMTDDANRSDNNQV